MGFNLRKYCKSTALSWLLPRLLSKKCCSMIPISGEKAKVVNCYVIYILNKDGELLYIVSGVDTEKNELYLNSINHENEIFSVPETLTLSDILEKQIIVRHYYKEFSIQYNSMYYLFFKFLTKYDVVKCKCRLLWEGLSQSRFNKKPFVAQESIELLKFIYNNQLDQYNSQPYSVFTSPTTGISKFELMTKIYSPRWIEHPYSERQKYKLKIHLDSLVQSGDLNEDDKGYRYIVTGKALKTIEDYDKEERRHQDSQRMQWIIVMLTFVIAFSPWFKHFIIDSKNP